MAEDKTTQPEKVEKAPKLSGVMVHFASALNPNIKGSMPKEQWEAGMADGLFKNSVFDREEPAK